MMGMLFGGKGFRETPTRIAMHRFALEISLPLGCLIYLQIFECYSLLQLLSHLWVFILICFSVCI